MRILKRGLGLLLVVVLVAVVAAAGFLTWVTVRAMPETTGTIAATGLGAPVTVARDAAGIAHITADTPHDLFFAQGYVHASERMWQMEVWRHISAGRLAEVFGASQLDTDKFIRTLGWRVAAQRDLDAVAPPARAVLDAYTAGRQRVAGHASRVARAGVPRRRRHARAVDEPRHDRLGQGPGLEPGRQLRLRGVPVPGRPAAGRPGPDG